MKTKILVTIQRALDELRVSVNSLVGLNSTIQSDLTHLQNHAKLPQEMLIKIDQLLKVAEDEPHPQVKIKMTLPILLNFVEWESEYTLPEKPFQQLWQKIKRVCIPSP